MDYQALNKHPEVVRTVFDNFFCRDDKFARLFAQSAMQNELQIIVDLSHDGVVAEAPNANDVRERAVQSFRDALRDFEEQVIGHVWKTPMEMKSVMIVKAQITFPPISE